MENYLWVEKYRPKTLEDVILPDKIKASFREFIGKKNLPNLILSGGPGCGKTTIAKAVLEDIGCQYLVINASLEGNIDTLRTTIKDFASSMSISGRKFVILDEADYLTPAVQPALRNFMEEFSSNCGFILTCNFKHKIIEPLHSRCSLIEFSFSKQEKAELATHMFKRIKHILDSEHIEYDKKVIIELIKRHFPDFRKIINEIQRCSISGKIDSAVLTDFDSIQIRELVGYLKEKDFTSLRKWSVEAEYDDIKLYRKLYDTASEYVELSSVPQMILILSKYMYQSAFVVDKEINTMACLVEIMIECSFK